MSDKFRIIRTDYFEEWFALQNSKIQGIIQSRLDRILAEGHFGWIHFFDGLIELKSRSGLRIYTARLGNDLIVVLAGGTKHGQSKDIEKAKKILEEIKTNGFCSS